MIELKLFPEGYAHEAFQSLDIKFAFVNSDMEQVHLPIKCRDFLGDCIWSYKLKEKAQIYGFKYEYSKSPYDLDILRLSLKFPNQAAKKYFIKNLGKLHSIEDKAGVGHTIIEETQNSDTLLITADKAWQSNVWKISIYTFLIKRFSYKDDKGLQNPENHYIEAYLKYEDKWLTKINTLFTEQLTIDISNAHNASGFVSLYNEHNSPSSWSGEFTKNNSKAILGD